MRTLPKWEKVARQLLARLPADTRAVSCRRDRVTFSLRRGTAWTRIGEYPDGRPRFDRSTPTKSVILTASAEISDPPIRWERDYHLFGKYLDQPVPFLAYNLFRLNSCAVVLAIPRLDAVARLERTCKKARRLEGFNDFIADTATRGFDPDPVLYCQMHAGTADRWNWKIREWAKANRAAKTASPNPTTHVYEGPSARLPSANRLPRRLRRTMRIY